MTTFESNHTVIIPQCDQNGQQQNIRIPAEIMPKTAHLTEMNAHTLHTCEASVDGVCCGAPADFSYPTHEFISRHLCDYHFRMILRLIRLWHWRRVMTYVDEQEQKGRVA